MVDAIIDAQWDLVFHVGENLHYGGVKLDQIQPRIGGHDRRRQLYDDIVPSFWRANEVLRALVERGEDLQGQIELERGEKRDKQEAAIYVFTVSHTTFLRYQTFADARKKIVTVIFLPLSFVSSLFGMNTGDIRTLQSGQWIFWAVAVPLTVLVISLALWYAEHIGPRRSESSASRASNFAEPPRAPQMAFESSDPFYGSHRDPVDRYSTERQGLHPEAPERRPPFRRRL